MVHYSWLEVKWVKDQSVNILGWYQTYKIYNQILKNNSS